MVANPKEPFVFGCSLSVFPAEEVAVLTERGAHLEALAAGTIPPATLEEEHFRLVHVGEAEPRTVAERAWMRLIGRREFERDSAAKPPHDPPKNYGMVEFDADRCWW